MRRDGISVAMRRSREDWKSLVAEYRRSGLSAAEFARRRGLKVGTLRWWSSQLQDLSEQTVEFLALRPVAPEPCSHIEVAVGTIVVRFEVGTDTEYLASLLSRLGSAC